MSARRARVLDEACRLLDQGIDRFTVRELCQRAKVSRTMLYAIYNHKEHIIASAIATRHNAIMAQLFSRPDRQHAADTLVSYVAVADAIAAMPDYAAMMAASFFSPAADNPAHDMLDRLFRNSSNAWFQHAESRGAIRPLSPIARERLLALTSNAAFAAVVDWAAARISLDELRQRLKSNFLMCIFPVMRPPLRKATLRLLQRSPSHAGARRTD